MQIACKYFFEIDVVLYKALYHKTYKKPYSTICNVLKNANCINNTSDTCSLCREENKKITNIQRIGGR